MSRTHRSQGSETGARSGAWTGEFMLVVGVKRIIPAFTGPSAVVLAAYLYDPVGDTWQRGAEIEVTPVGGITTSWLEQQLAVFAGRGMLGYVVQ